MWKVSEKIWNKTSKRQKNCSRQAECEPVHRSGPDLALAHQHGVDLGLRSQCWAGARLEEVSYTDFILVL